MRKLVCIDRAQPASGEIMPQSKPSLTKAKAVLRELWPEVIQYLGDRANQSKTSANPAPDHALNEVAANA